VFLKRQKRVKRLEGIISYGVSTIWGSHGGEYEVGCLLSCSEV
jgi:hypothetical protein